MNASWSAYVGIYTIGYCSCRCPCSVHMPPRRCRQLRHIKMQRMQHTLKVHTDQIVFIIRQLFVFMFYKIIIVQHPSQYRSVSVQWSSKHTVSGESECVICTIHIDRCDRRTLVSCPMTNDVCNQQRQLQLHHMSKSIMFTWMCRCTI